MKDIRETWDQLVAKKATKAESHPSSRYQVRVGEVYSNDWQKILLIQINPHSYRLRLEIEDRAGGYHITENSVQSYHFLSSEIRKLYNTYSQFLASETIKSMDQ